MTFEVELPNGCIESGSVAILQYMDAEGELNFVIRMNGDLPLSSYVGLLELAKFRLASEAEELWEEEDG